MCACVCARVTREPRVFQPCVRGRMWLIAANLGYVIRDGRKCLDCVQPSPTASRLISFARPSFFPFFLSPSFRNSFFFHTLFYGKSCSGGDIFRPIILEEMATKDRRMYERNTTCCRYLSTYKAARWNLHIILMQFAIRIATAQSRMWALVLCAAAEWTGSIRES